MNQPSLNLPFSSSEYKRRLQKTQNAMKEKGIDLLFVEDPSNMAWLTGYDGWSFYVHQGVLVFLDQEPAWWGRLQDANGAKLTVYMDHKHIHGYADSYVQSTTHHPMEDLAKVIKKYGYEKSSIGLELDNYYFSAQAYITLQKELKQANFVNATALVNWERMVKSSEEIVFMEKAAKIAEEIILTAVNKIKPGLKKNELVADIYSTAIRGVDENWGDYPAIVPLLPSGRFASAPHLTWDDNVFKKDEGTFFEIAGCYKRYHIPLCRTVFLGKPDPKFLNAEAALREGLEAGIEVAQAGARAKDVANKLYESLERHNIKRDGRCGYPIGISYPPDWGERTISLRKEDENILLPGMTFHFMPGLWMDSWGLEITESIHIQEKGPARCFTHLPRKIFVVD